jgi:hypothetical protein
MILQCGVIEALLLPIIRDEHFFTDSENRTETLKTETDCFISYKLGSMMSGSVLTWY